MAERTTIREIGGNPILWEDESGILHACEGATVHPGIRLIWTLCERDVPANGAFTSREPTTCERCNHAR